MPKKKAISLFSVLLIATSCGQGNNDAIKNSHKRLKPGMAFAEVVGSIETSQISDLDVIIRSDGCNPDYELGRDTGPLYIKFWNGPYDPVGPYKQEGFSSRTEFMTAVHSKLPALTACQKFLVLMTRYQGMGNMDIFEMQFDKSGKLISFTEPQLID